MRTFQGTLLYAQQSSVASSWIPLTPHAETHDADHTPHRGPDDVLLRARHKTTITRPLPSRTLSVGR